jgi:hypothetical protein
MHAVLCGAAELTDTLIMRDLKRTNDVDQTYARVRPAGYSRSDTAWPLLPPV